MVEATIMGDVVAKIMVVTHSLGVAGNLDLLQQSLVRAMDRQVIGPIVIVSPGGMKRKHLMMLSQVLFWSMIVWLLYCLILDPHFHIYLPQLLLVLIYIVFFLTRLFVFLLRWVSL